MSVIHAITQRRSVKHFDTHACVEEADFKVLIENAMLAPTSFNIQHWRFVRIKDPKLRQQLRGLAFDQPQVTEASELIAITADIGAWDKQTSRYWCDVDAQVAEQIVTTLDEFYRGHEQLQRDEAIRSAAFAAQNIMLTAHELGYGCCPMIGFDVAGVASLIDLPNDHLVVMLLAVGRAREAPMPRGGQLDLSEVLLVDGFNR